MTIYFIIYYPMFQLNAGRNMRPPSHIPTHRLHIHLSLSSSQNEFVLGVTLSAGGDEITGVKKKYGARLSSSRVFNNEERLGSKTPDHSIYIPPSTPPPRRAPRFSFKPFSEGFTVKSHLSFSSTSTSMSTLEVCPLAPQPNPLVDISPSP